MSNWIGVDFDGTLVNYNASHSMENIGAPIEATLLQVQRWLADGIDVRIFTARATDEGLIEGVQQWLAANDLPALQVTNRKDFDLLQIWDDRAIQVGFNTGEVLTPKEYISLDVSGWMGVELDGTLAHYEKGQDPMNIGEPVPIMRTRVQQWLMAGIDIRLFTARATLPSMIPVIEEWLQQYGLGDMKITCEKDFAMSQFWDDRGVHVVSNTGQIVTQLETVVPENKFRG